MATRSLHLVVSTRRQMPVYTGAIPFRANHWEDLERFEETERWHNKNRFLNNARQEIEHKKGFVTHVEGGKLVFLGWINYDIVNANLTHVQQRIEFLPRAASHYSVYVHPRYRGRGLFSQGLRFIAEHTFQNSPAELLFGAVEGGNGHALKGHMNAGFVPTHKITTRRLLGRCAYAMEKLTCLPPYS